MPLLICPCTGTGTGTQAEAQAQAQVQAHAGACRRRVADAAAGREPLPSMLQAERCPRLEAVLCLPPSCMVPNDDVCFWPLPESVHSFVVRGKLAAAVHAAVWGSLYIVLLCIFDYV